MIQLRDRKRSYAITTAIHFPVIETPLNAAEARIRVAQLPQTEALSQLITLPVGLVNRHVHCNNWGGQCVHEHVPRPLECQRRPFQSLPHSIIEATSPCRGSQTTEKFDRMPLMVFHSALTRPSPSTTSHKRFLIQVNEKSPGSSRILATKSTRKYASES